MKKKYSLTIRGERHTWGFDIMVDPKHVEDWRSDGLTVDEICNTVPESVAYLSYWPTKTWCFFQDIFHFKNPFSK